MSVAPLAEELPRQNPSKPQTNTIIETRASSKPRSYQATIMLVIPLKCTSRYDLRDPLAKFLDGDPAVPANPLTQVCLKPDFKSHQVRQELVRLASLRNCLSDSIAKPNSHKVALEDMALQDCHEYHAALLEFIRRGFPTNDEASLTLTWKASVGPQTETHASLEWDRACIIWNIAALESYLASIQSSDKEGRKQVVKHCQTAASMMRYLHDEVISQCHFATVDLSVPSLQFWEMVMLAQAQCAAYQVAQDNPQPKHSILSILAMGAVPLFNEALKQSKDTLLVSQLPVPAQEWSVYCKSWSMLMSAKAAHHQAMAAQESQSWGLEIVWLQETMKQLQSSKSFLGSSGDNSSMENVIDAKISTVERRLAEATKDNQLIYGEQLPRQLPTITPKQLVKSEMETMPETMTKPKVSLFC